MLALTDGLFWHNGLQPRFAILLTFRVSGFDDAVRKANDLIAMRKLQLFQAEVCIWNQADRRAGVGQAVLDLAICRDNQRWIVPGIHVGQDAAFPDRTSQKTSSQANMVMSVCVVRM